MKKILKKDMTLSLPKGFTLSRIFSAMQNFVGGDRHGQRENRPGSVRRVDGFTLIELLVVIAIIAIITSIGVANLITAQKQARDSARREIIGNVQSAFEQYFVEFGEYPSLDHGSAFEGGVTPVDPKEDSNPLSWNVSDVSYCVCATLENGTGNATAPLGSSCTWSDTGTYYCAQNKQ